MDNEIATKRYCGQDGYTIIRELLSKKCCDKKLSKSIQHQASIIYNKIYRLYSGRVKIVTSTDDNNSRTGSIFVTITIVINFKSVLMRWDQNHLLLSNSSDLIS
jgi:hypothetical protein